MSAERRRDLATVLVPIGVLVTLFVLSLLMGASPATA